MFSKEDLIGLWTELGGKKMKKGVKGSDAKILGCMIRIMVVPLLEILSRIGNLAWKKIT